LHASEHRCSIDSSALVVVARNGTCTPAIAAAQLKTGHELLYYIATTD